MSNLKYSLALLLMLSGCIDHSTSTYQVGHDQDSFTETVDGRTVRFANWKLSIGNRVIEVPHVDSTVIVRRAGNHLKVEVNEKTVYED
jgi:hypothetical protein